MIFDSIRKSLRWRLAFTSSLITVGMLVLLIVNNARLLSDSIEEQRQLQISESSRLLNVPLAGHLFERDYARTREILKELIGPGGSFTYLLVLDERGELFAHAGSADFKALPQVQSTPDRGELIFHGAFPLRIGAQQVGALRYGLSSSVLFNTREAVLRQSTLIAIVAIVLTTAMLLLIDYWLTRDLKRLVEATRRISAGNYDARVEIATGDEIGQLAQSFDQMAGAVEEKQQQLIRTNRVLRVISAGNQTMLRATSEQQLIEDMCRAIVEAGGYRIAWIGYAENDAERSIRPAAQWGAIAAGFFDNARLTWGEAESGRTPPGNALRSGIPVAVQDISKETGPEPWRENALHCGCGSCVALPLRVGANVIGVLDVCADEIGAFGDNEVDLLAEAAADLSYGIATLRGVAEIAPLKAALRTAEERIRTAAEASLDALFILKSVRDLKNNIVDFQFVDINASAEEMLGMPRDKVIGGKFSVMLPVNGIVRLFDNCAQVVNSGTAMEEEFAVDIPEIKAKWLRSQVVRVDDGVAISLRDITAWKAAGARLRESEETLRTIASSAQDAIVMLDNDGNIALWNAASEKIFGHSSEEALGKNLHLLLAPTRFHEAHETGFRHFRATGEGAVIGKTLELAALKKDGTEFPVELSLSAVKLKDKWHAVGIVRDNTERKRAEEKLRLANAVVESSPTVLFRWRAAEGWPVEYVSENVRQFGYAAEELLSRTVPYASLIYPDDLARVGAEVTRFSVDGGQFSQEYRIVTRNGAVRWVDDTTTVERDSTGNIAHFQGVITDITERKRAQQAEQEQFKFAEAFFNHSVSCLVILDRNFNFIRVNEAYARACRKDIGDFAGRNHFEMYPSDAQSIFDEVVRTRRPYATFTRAFVYPDQPERGTTYWDWTLVPVLDRNGEVEYLVFSLNEVTERKRAEEEQRTAARYARSLIEASLDPLVTISPQGKIMDVNRMTEEVTGVARTELIGTDFTDYFTEPEQARAGYRQVLAQGYVRDYLLTIRHHAGHTTDVLYNATVYRNEAGELQGVFAAARDITERKKGELALERANRALRTLSACNEALVRTGNESELLNSICQLIVETGGYRMAWVGVPEHDPAKTVRPVAQYGHEEGFLAATKFSWADTDFGRGPTGTAIRTGTVQVNQYFLTNPHMAPWREAALVRGYQSSIALPLMSTAGTLGVLTIDASEPEAFNTAEVKLLQELAEGLAFGIGTARTRADRDRIAYEHLHHAEILQQSLEDSIKAIADTVEMRDPYTAGHQRRVGELAVAVSKELGLAEETIRGIELAAGIHDLGKIKVPAEILSKPGKLTDIEFMLIKLHPRAGYDILKDIKFPWPIAIVVWQHHERLDGSGYPQGLKDGQILLESRIMAVADVVEAMASHRPYRAALGIDIALKEIERGRGTAYDAAVADACLRLFAEKRFSFSA